MLLCLPISEKVYRHRNFRPHNPNNNHFAYHRVICLFAEKELASSLKERSNDTFHLFFIVRNLFFFVLNLFCDIFHKCCCYVKYYIVNNLIFFQFGK